MKDKEKNNGNYQYCLLKEVTVAVPSPGDMSLIDKFLNRLQNELTTSLVELINERSSTDMALDLVTVKIGQHRVAFNYNVNPPSETLLSVREGAYA